MKNLVEYVYTIRGANYEYEYVLFVSLDKDKRDAFFKEMQSSKDLPDEIACEDIPLDHYRLISFDDWKPIENFYQNGVE